jgi:hypothetical protein
LSFHGSVDFSARFSVEQFLATIRATLEIQVWHDQGTATDIQSGFTVDASQ